MNVKFLNPFVEAAKDVIQVETGLNVDRGELNLMNADYITDDVTVIISLVGNVVGNVFYSMNEKTAITLASKMLGEPLVNFTSLAQSGIAELGNVITGRASVKLSEAGYEANISPPTLLCGSGATISTLDFQRLVLPLKVDGGQIDIHLALREGIQRQISAAELPTPAMPEITP